MEIANLNSFVPKSQLMFVPKKAIEDLSPVEEMMSSFADIFERHLKKVDNHLKESEDLTNKLATGEVQDVHSVMIAAQKASIALNFTIALRDKMIAAYTEILAMGR